jgi:hypothetical protein
MVGHGEVALDAALEARGDVAELERLDDGGNIRYNIK